MYGGLYTQLLSFKRWKFDYSHLSVFSILDFDADLWDLEEEEGRGSRQWHPWQQDQITSLTWETIFTWVLINRRSTTVRSLTSRRRISSSAIASSTALTSLSVATRFAICFDKRSSSSDFDLFRSWVWFTFFFFGLSQLVIGEINEAAATPLQAVKLLAMYLSSPENKVIQGILRYSFASIHVL